MDLLKLLGTEISKTPWEPKVWPKLVQHSKESVGGGKCYGLLSVNVECICTTKSISIQSGSFFFVQKMSSKYVKILILTLIFIFYLKQLLLF